MEPRVTVVGAGVIGLTTAVALAEDGWSVEVITNVDPMSTTSTAGTGLIGLSFGAEPRDRVPNWEK